MAAWRSLLAPPAADGSFYITTGASLQAELGECEVGMAMLVLPPALPVGEEVEDRDREGEVHLEAVPQAVPGPLELADARQQREHRLDQDALRPGAALADLQVRRVARLAVEVAVGQHDRMPLEARDQ